MKTSPPLIVYFISVDWFFCSHFIDRAIAAQEAGYRVLILCNVDRHAAVIEAAGLRLLPLPLNRRSLNPLAAFITLMRVYRIYRRERPALVHHVALKPILLGCIASRLAGVPATLNAIVGGGYLFNSSSFFIKAIRPLLISCLGFLLKRRGSWTVFENIDDLREFNRAGLVATSNSVLIRGAGVDPGGYLRSTLLADPPIVILVARLLWDKGVGEFVEAARALRGRGVVARFVIVGDPDAGNRACIDPVTLNSWKTEGVVELWGYRNDIPRILAEATIACLPSYREGLPRSLLEAMAAGLPCVTTDVPGCREAVRDGDNGLLVPAKDSHALAGALELLLLKPELANKMGARGRERLEQEFSAQHVNERTLALYREMLAR